MAAPATSSELELLERRARVARLKLEGLTQQEIALELKVSQSTICQDLKAVKAMWREQAAGDFADMKAEEKAKLDRVEREAILAWERSKSARETKQVRKKSAAAQDGEMSIRKENQDGDPRYLDLIIKTIKARTDLYGLAAPTKIDLNDVSDRSTESLESELVRYIAGAMVGGDEDDSLGETGSLEDRPVADGHPTEGASSGDS